MDLGDHHPREGPDGLGQLNGRRRAVPVPRGRVDLAQEMEIEAGTIGLARPPRDHRLDLAVGADDVERIEERRHQFPVERVAFLRPVVGDPRDAGINEPL